MKFAFSSLTSYNKKTVGERKKNLKLNYLVSFLFLFLILASFVIFKNFLKFEKISPNRQKFRALEQAKSLTPTPIPPSITLIFTGDVIPGRSVNATMTKLNNFKYPFEKTADFLKNADLTIINLEAPLVDNCPVTESGMVFCGNPKFIEGMLFAGIDLATLANNHSSNWGKDGIDRTVEILSQNNIDSAGYHNIVYKEIKGVKFAFLGYNGISPLVDELSKIDKEKIKNEIEEAQKSSDFIIAMYHWGKEYSPFPTTDGEIASHDPQEIGRFTIDSGADLVIGNHPHVVQGYEVYKEKLIFYALGNFIFDQMWSYETRVGAVLKMDLIGNQVNSFSLHPVLIENYSQPKFLEGDEKGKILQKMEQIESQ